MVDKMSVQCLLILSVEMIIIFEGFADGKSAKMAGIMHQVEHLVIASISY